MFKGGDLGLPQLDIQFACLLVESEVRMWWI